MPRSSEVAGTPFQGEQLNALSHLIGAVLAIACTIVLIALIALAALTGEARKVVGVTVFGTTLMIRYSISTLHHAPGGRAKAVLQRFDHRSIHLLIAGSAAHCAAVVRYVLSRRHRRINRRRGVPSQPTPPGAHRGNYSRPPPEWRRSAPRRAAKTGRSA